MADVGTADAAKFTDEQLSEAMDVAMHDATFTFYHESGHLLVHELGLPVLGKEEDAADSLAVVQIFKNTDDADELFNTMNDVADGLTSSEPSAAVLWPLAQPVDVPTTLLARGLNPGLSCQRWQFISGDFSGDRRG